MSDLRHVNVAILYGQGQKNRAQAIARKLRRQSEVVQLTRNYLDSTTQEAANQRDFKLSRP